MDLENMYDGMTQEVKIKQINTSDSKKRNIEYYSETPFILHLSQDVHFKSRLLTQPPSPEGGRLFKKSVRGVKRLDTQTKAAF